MYFEFESVNPNHIQLTKFIKTHQNSSKLIKTHRNSSKVNKVDLNHIEFGLIIQISMEISQNSKLLSQLFFSLEV